MTEKTESKVVELREQSTTAVRKAYLANLGLYGKLYEEGQERIESLKTARVDLRSKSTELFEELVARGEKLQSDAEAKFESLQSDSKAKIESLKSDAEAKIEEGKAELEGRFEKVKSVFAGEESKEATA